MWTGIGIGGFVLLTIAGLLAYYFGSVHEEFFSATTGRLLDCGTIFAANDTPLAVANCGGVSQGDAVGFILMVVAIAIALAAMILGFVKERSGPARRR